MSKYDIGDKIKLIAPHPQRKSPIFSNTKEFEIIDILTGDYKNHYVLKGKHLEYGVYFNYEIPIKEIDESGYYIRFEVRKKDKYDDWTYWD